MPGGATDYTAEPRLSYPASMSRRIANLILGLLLGCGGMLINAGAVSGQGLIEAPPFETPVETPVETPATPVEATVETPAEVKAAA